MEQLYKIVGMIGVWTLIILGTSLFCIFLWITFWTANMKHDTWLFQLVEFLKVKWKMKFREGEYEIDLLVGLKKLLTEGPYKKKIFKKTYLRDIEKILSKKWKRHRFKTYSISDNRPLIFNPKYPWWCTGYGEDHCTIVAYLPFNEDLLKYWDDAFDVESENKDKIEFTSRFPRPESFIES